MKNEEYSITASIAGGIVVIFPILMWEDYVWLQKLPWSAELLVALVFAIFVPLTSADKIISKTMGCIFIATLILQILSWTSVVTLPIIK